MKTLQIKKILVPVDFSETSMLAIEHGALMAGLYKAEMILLNVIRPHWFDMNLVTPGVMADADWEEWSKNSLHRLDKLAENIQKEYGLECEVMCVLGSICKTIIDVADDNKADIIVMGTHGASGLEEKFIGSNAYRVVNEAHCPVVTVQSHPDKKGFKNIVLPIDHSEYSRQKVGPAITLANRYGATIHILGLLAEEDETSRKKLEIKIDQVKALLQKNNLSYDSRMETGSNFAVLTLNHAAKINADLIVIMTEWEEELTGLFIGPFARQIVNHSRIPVMSIRPEVHPENIPAVHPY